MTEYCEYTVYMCHVLISIIICGAWAIITLISLLYTISLLPENLHSEVEHASYQILIAIESNQVSPQDENYIHKINAQHEQTAVYVFKKNYVHNAF